MSTDSTSPVPSVTLASLSKKRCRTPREADSDDDTDYSEGQSPSHSSISPSLSPARSPSHSLSPLPSPCPFRPLSYYSSPMRRGERERESCQTPPKRLRSASLEELNLLPPPTPTASAANLRKTQIWLR